MGNHSLQNAHFKQSEKKILHSMGLVSVLFIIKLSGGISAGSLALLSDSLHLITDFFALLISWIGLKLTTKPASYKYTYGHYRHSILTAFINNIFLIGISFFILYKAYQRYLRPMPVEPSLMIVFSILGIIVNILILVNLKTNKNNMNVKSALLHFIGDAAADVSVLIGAVIMYFTGITIIDTLLSAILSILILINALRMSGGCIKIFLEAVPKGISLDALKASLKTINQIIEVKDLHVWSLSQEVIAMTAHITTTEQDSIAREKLLHEIQHLLEDEFGIIHSTIQLENSPCSSCYHHHSDHHADCSLCIDCCQKKNYI